MQTQLQTKQEEPTNNSEQTYSESLHCHKRNSMVDSFDDGLKTVTRPGKKKK